MKSKKVVIVFIFITFSFGLIYGLDNLSTVRYKEANQGDNLSISSFKDSHSLEWNFTGKGSHAYAITSDSSGNIYITGRTNGDIYLAKFNSSNHLQWNQTWGGNEYETINQIVLDSFNNIYLGGCVDISFGFNQLLLVKFNSFGQYQWNQTWGGGTGDFWLGMAVDSIDNIYLVGSTDNFTISAVGCLVKFNSLGQYQWNRTWGGNSYGRGTDIVIDPSDNIYITGDISGVGGLDAFLIKYNNLGQYQWNRTYNFNIVQQATSIALDSLNNIYIGGLVTNFSLLDGDMFLLKYNQTGELQWDHIWGISGMDIIYDIALDSDNNIYLVGGVNNSAAKDFDFTLIHYDTSGLLQYNQTWGGNNKDIFLAITIDLTDNLYLTGMKDGTNLYIEKYSRDIVTQNGQLSDNGIPFGNNYIIVITFSVVTLIIVDLKRRKLKK